MDIEQLKYPIGKFKKPELVTPELLRQWISVIADFPALLTSTVLHLNNLQLDTPYRPGGWTVRQVVHHCADSHMNSLMRLKLTLTEETPTIKPYMEDRWAELIDSKTLPVISALQMLEGIHLRWTTILQQMQPSEFARTFFHPQQNKTIRLDENTALYAWHCNHHLAHITTLKKQQGWK